MMKLRDKEGRLPVHILAFNGSIDTLRAICKDGTQPLEEKDFMNASLAHHASAGGQVGLSLSHTFSLSLSLSLYIYIYMYMYIYIYVYIYIYI